MSITSSRDPPHHRTSSRQSANGADASRRDFAYVEVTKSFNLACPASPVHNQLTLGHQASVIGAINMLGLAKRLKVRVLQASTSEIYGDPECPSADGRVLGQRQPDRPAILLRRRKAMRGDLFFDYRRQHNMPIKVVRIFNTYGPRMHPNDGRVVSNFIVQALTGKVITIYGDGSQTRSFCYVDDLIEGMLRMMSTPPDVTGPINIGNPKEFNIRQLAELVIEITGTKSAQLTGLP